MRPLVIGGAGFIGSHLVDRLAARGRVTVFDDLSAGREAFIAEALASGHVTLVRGDAKDPGALVRAMRDHDVVVHLVANPEARAGLLNTRLDLEQGTITTYNALEAARTVGATRFILASSGTVYGDTPEPCAEGDLGHLPISLYGASKLACEGLVSAYAECFALQGTIMRFGNVVGPRATHGVIVDLFAKLRTRPDVLDVLGNGSQSKPYLHVTDCAAALLHVLDHAAGPLDVFNLAPDDATRVATIAELCVAASPSPRTRIAYGEGPKGWLGDVPTSRLVSAKLAALGFRLERTSNDAVVQAIGEVAREVFGR